MDNPDPKSVAAYNSFSCGADTQSANVNPDTGELVPGDRPQWPLVACDDQGLKYLLSTSMVEGTDLDDASAQIPQNDVNWVVSLDFNGHGSDLFADISRALYGTQKQFAIVLDGNVISAPTMEGIITNGQAQISGSFNQESAESLATSLRYGSLPIAFEEDPTVETIGPSLAGNQLSAGIFAGLLGLVAVMIYCLLYYRGLGLVVVASLFVAAGITYGLVLLLGETAGFTLTLPGIAGLIVAVGITADSFIVYFERIRDEMRDGKTMRVAVEAGWKRARNTCLAADTVSLLAAVVLYIFAAGVVRGFAFALGIATLIDLVVFFWFTHPLVSWLARHPFFNQGHKLSGLDAEALGIDRINLAPATPQTVEGGPDGQVLQARQRPLLRQAVDRLRRPQVALVLDVRSDRAARRGGPLLPGPQHGHRVRGRRAVPRHARRATRSPRTTPTGCARQSPPPASRGRPRRSSPPRAKRHHRPDQAAQQRRLRGGRRHDPGHGRGQSGRHVPGRDRRELGSATSPSAR